MESRRAFIRWFIIGAATAAILVVAEANSSGGVAGLIRVGEDSVVRPIVESELGDVPLTEGYGHDGQFFYAIGIDLSGREISSLSEDWAYRYRRIAYPTVASIFGLLDGYALLYSMMVVNILAAAVAAGSVAATAVSLGSSEWVALTVILNPGVWLSVSLLTSDAFGLSLMCLGLMLFVRRVDRGALAAFVFSVLAKETFLVTPGGLAVSKDRRRWRYAMIPALALIAWMTITQFTIGGGFVTRGNLDIPFRGVLEAAGGWGAHRPIDWFYTAFTLMSVFVGALVALTRRTWLSLSLIGWAGLAVISSQLVWEFGNNAARAFLAIPILIGLVLVSPGSGTWSERPAIRC